MKFAKKSDEELTMLNLIEPGTYDFEVIDAQDKVSRAGNDMISITLRIWDNHGRERQVYDYLLESFPVKLKHFAKVTGLLDKYELGEIVASDCLRRSGRVEVIIKPEEPNPSGGIYPAKNNVKDYLLPDKITPITKPKVDDFDCEELPF
jgi:hypothetical protein